MATLETLTVDVVQELLHEQIKALVQTFANETYIKVDCVYIKWVDINGAPPQAYKIELHTSLGYI